MKICKTITFFILSWGIAANVSAVDLMDVYKQALANDPSFKSARSQWAADRENLAISKAEFFPQISASGGLTRSRNLGESNGSDTDLYNKNVTYSLNLTQSLFNFGNWANVWYAEAVAKKAEATFLAAEEYLLQRTAQAYFDVLLAKDVLSYAKANKASVKRLLLQAKHKYDVGLTAIVDLEDARKNYDIAVADEITAINDLDDKFERLAEITGIRYDDLVPVKPNFPLLSPKPANMEEWVQVAKTQNYDFIASRYNTIAARETVKVKNAGHVPTISANGGYNYNYDSNSATTGGFSRNKVGSVGVELSVPIFQGGKVLASAKQANYQYQTALAEQEKSYRSVVSETRQAYRGVLSNISKIKADLQAIKSSQSSLRATEANYNVGTRTMSDVLQAQTLLYNVQKSFANDEYSYIMQLIKLKSLTGILTVQDLAQINLWLEKKSQVTAQPATTSSKLSVQKKVKSEAAGTTKAAKHISTKSKASESLSSEIKNSTKVIEAVSPATNPGNDKTAAATNGITATSQDASKLVVLQTHEVKPIADVTNTASITPSTAANVSKSQ